VLRFVYQAPRDSSTLERFRRLRVREIARQRQILRIPACGPSVVACATAGSPWLVKNRKRSGIGELLAHEQQRQDRANTAATRPPVLY
jgi:hypothetical protein